MNRRERLFHDLGVALSGVWPPSRIIEARSQRKMVKRGGVMSKNQCILKAPNALVQEGSHSTSPANRTSTAAHGTSTGKGGATSTSSSSSTSTSTKTTKGSSTTTTSTTAASAPSSSYTKKWDASGNDFFDDWTFWSQDDPTHGTVQFTTQQDAQNSNLIDIDDDGNAIMRVDTTGQISGGRKAIRIHSEQTFNGGLWVLDAMHMPTGCGTWPAFWTHGPNWPQDGEIDIVEGVNENTYNQMTLHTAPGCTVNPDAGGSGKLLGSVCGAAETGNAGCGIVDNNADSYGGGYNSNGGGVHVMLWADEGVSIWFFPRGSIPKDLTSEAPQPDNWGQPSAHFPSSTCSAYGFNRDHTTIFDTTFCGDWAAAAWGAAPNQGGQSCAEKTGVATCQEYVQNHGADFSEAYWKVKSVKVYQTS
ncbi:hypothetical protein FRB90_001770 [Tulasnella sp. 427]|nr:hypothetical protein FRB90_001770 [Tulasnella sp. 427]